MEMVKLKFYSYLMYFVLYTMWFVFGIPLLTPDTFRGIILLAKKISHLLTYHCHKIEYFFFKH